MTCRRRLAGLIQCKVGEQALGEAFRLIFPVVIVLTMQCLYFHVRNTGKLELLLGGYDVDQFVRGQSAEEALCEKPI
jgi:hypothetical protein